VGLLAWKGTLTFGGERSVNRVPVTGRRGTGNPSLTTSPRLLSKRVGISAAEGQSRNQPTPEEVKISLTSAPETGLRVSPSRGNIFDFQKKSHQRREPDVCPDTGMSHKGKMRVKVISEVASLKLSRAERGRRLIRALPTTSSGAGLPFGCRSGESESKKYSHRARSEHGKDTNYALFRDPLRNSILGGPRGKTRPKWLIGPGQAVHSAVQSQGNWPLHPSRVRESFRRRGLATLQPPCKDITPRKARIRHHEKSSLRASIARGALPRKRGVPAAPPPGKTR